jgi:eukaryotic-like serine/threonine-protein kinase
MTAQENSIGPCISIGTCIDARYRLDAFLGDGSIGVVYRAHDVRLDRTVALKIVRAERFGDMLDRFQKEARALAQVRHANVVQIHALGEHETDLYIAMEFIDGPSLGQVIEHHAASGTTVPIEDAVAIVERVSAGLGEVHDKGLVHRDVKPSNIVIEEGTRRPVLVDFGLARRVTRSSPKLSIIAGTPCYMAPEQARDRGGASSRSDIYGLACTTFELLTGRPVFDEPDLLAILRAHAEMPAPRLSTLRAELAAFDGVLLRALAKRPDERYQSCAQFAAAFGEAARDVARTDAPRRRTCLRTGRPVIRAVVLQRADGLQRHVLRIFDSVFYISGDAVEVESVTSEREFVAAFARDPADLVLIDDDTTLGRSEILVEALRATPLGVLVEIAVLERESSRPMHLGRLNAISVPKPVNMQVLRSVVRKMCIRTAVRKARESSPPFACEPCVASSLRPITRTMTQRESEGRGR